MIYYLLVFYVLFQFGWWAYLLVDLNREVYNQKIASLKKVDSAPELIQENQVLLKKMHERWLMVASEGIVFLSLLLLGVFITRKAIYKEVALARQQKNFILSITHEFKSPLAAIKLNLQTLLKHQFEKDRQQLMLSQAIHETDRINALVENALLAARLEGHSYKLDAEEVSLGELVSLALHSRTYMTYSHPLDIQVEPDVFISGDTLSLTSAVLNLVENAEKYSPENNPIKVEVIKQGRHALLRVTDTGPGIPDEEKGKIFEKFYRVGNEDTRRSKGTGLGLFIVRHIADLHHGSILVKNNQPKGSIFELRFPLTNQEPSS